MSRKSHIRDVHVTENLEGRFVVETYDDGTVVRRRVEEDGRPRRRPRKPFARAWQPGDKPRTKKAIRE
jgi:hypothetical protein